MSQEPLFSTSQASSLIYSLGLAPVALFSMETNPEDANLSLSKITNPNLSWKGMCCISSTSSISRPQFRSEDDYEVLSQNGGHQILRRVNLNPCLHILLLQPFTRTTSASGGHCNSHYHIIHCHHDHFDYHKQDHYVCSDWHSSH